jgi:peptidoglycan/xylan/chitin deacetylase (PgdA/CDA1 family)
MLHQVRNSSRDFSDEWSISHNKFLELLDYLHTSNYKTITFADIALNKNILNSSGKKVILTFDDGYKHLFDFAIPELVKRKMKAVFYIPTAHLADYNSWDSEKNYEKLEIMNESDLRKLDNLGMEVGSHSHHHIRLKENKNAHEVEEELLLSKQTIELITQKPVYSVAFPFASVPKGYKKLLYNAGFFFGLSIYQPFESRYALRRLGYYSSDTKNSLKLKLSFAYKFLRALHDPFLKY